MQKFQKVKEEKLSISRTPDKSVMLNTSMDAQARFRISAKQKRHPELVSGSQLTQIITSLTQGVTRLNK